MPSAAYNVSNHEDKIRRQDQSFRNCIVTMFVFIMICVIIIVVSLPWRNRNLQNHYEYHESAKSFTEQSTKNVSTELEKHKTTLNYSVPLSTKFLDTTTAPSITNQKVTESLSTTITKNIQPLSTEIHDNIEISSIDIRDNIGVSSTTVFPQSKSAIDIQDNSEVSSSTVFPSSKSAVDIQDNSEVSSSTVFPSSESVVDIQDNSEVSSSTVFPQSISTEYLSMTTSPKIEIPTETISLSSITEFQTSETSASSKSFTPSIESSDRFGFSSVSIFNHQSTITNENEFFHTEETVGSTMVSSTESTIISSSTNQQVTVSTDIPTTFFENVTQTSELKVSSGLDNDFTSLKKLIVEKYFGNESSTFETEINWDWLENDDITTSSFQENSTNRDENEISTEILTIVRNNETTENNILSRKIQTETMRPTTNDENQNYPTTNTYTDENEFQSTQNFLHQTFDDLKGKNEKKLTDNVCISGECKQISSKILSFMNHSADPCEDFYEYACGGMEIDPQINNRNLDDQAFDRIKSQFKKSKNNQEYSIFKDYYDSCIDYYQKTTQDEKIHQTKKILENIGQFYSTKNWPNDNSSYPGITKLIRNMILYNSPILFDVVPDIDEMNPRKFILRLGPLAHSQNLFNNEKKNICNIESDEMLLNEVDMNELYESYKNCKNNERQQLNSISKALKTFGIFNHINDTFDKSKYIKKIVSDIDHRIINGFSNYPHISEIQAAYKSKNYSIITVGQLEIQSKLISWTELIYALTGLHVTSDTKLQVYFKDVLFYIFKSFEKFDDLYDLNNALLGLYTQNLYEQFIISEIIGDSEEQCLHIAINYLPNDASRLYLSSFTKIEIDRINTTIYEVFDNLKETLKLKFEHAQWATQIDRNELLRKIEMIQISNPNNLYLEKTVNVNITHNFLDNIVISMKKFRTDMYRIMNKIPSDPEQLWTYFSKPFYSYGQAIYSLNIILIPFGAIDISTNTLQNDENFVYLMFAKIGSVIAREIAHHFDTNGILYWNGTRDFAFTHFNDEFTKASYDDYINCHSHLLFQEPINMLLPTSNKHIHIMIPQTTLNDRLSDIMGMRLAHDTLTSIESTSSKLLPWLNLNIHQLFYLTYAQTHCTKVPITTSYISLYENSIMPSRLRIFVAALNNKVLGELWKCREGSPVLPNFTCDTFPYFEYHNTPIANM